MKRITKKQELNHDIIVNPVPEKKVKVEIEDELTEDAFSPFTTGSAVKTESDDVHVVTDVFDIPWDAQTNPAVDPTIEWPSLCEIESGSFKYENLSKTPVEQQVNGKARAKVFIAEIPVLAAQRLAAVKNVLKTSKQTGRSIPKIKNIRKEVSVSNKRKSAKRYNESLVGTWHRGTGG